MVKVCVPVADGSEELELISITNPLRRAGVEVIVASVGNEMIEASRATKITADDLIDNVKDQDFDAIILPGGMPGATNLAENATLVDMLKNQTSKGKIIAAICASPAVVFASHGLLKSKAQCYPAPKFLEMLGDKLDNSNNVVVDDNVVTSVGPGTALEFGLKLVSLLCGAAKGKEIAEGMKFQGDMDALAA